MRNKSLLHMLDDDPTLLNLLSVPTGMDAATLVEVIKEKSGLLCPWIQDATKLKADVGLWSTARKADWALALGAATATYNPIHNYFREELGSEKTSYHKGSKRSTNVHEEETPAAVTDTGSVVAYNAGTESETGKNERTYTGKNTREALAASNFETLEDLSETVYDNDVKEYVDRVTQGNIGVTRSQEMVKDELELRLSGMTDLYERIAEEFQRKFLIECF